MPARYKNQMSLRSPWSNDIRGLYTHNRRKVKSKQNMNLVFITLSVFPFPLIFLALTSPGPKGLCSRAPMWTRWTFFLPIRFTWPAAQYFRLVVYCAFWETAPSAGVTADNSLLRDLSRNPHLGPWDQGFTEAMNKVGLWGRRAGHWAGAFIFDEETANLLYRFLWGGLLSCGSLGVSSVTSRALW